MIKSRQSKQRICWPACHSKTGVWAWDGSSTATQLGSILFNSVWFNSVWFGCLTEPPSGLGGIPPSYWRRRRKAISWRLSRTSFQDTQTLGARLSGGAKLSGVTKFWSTCQVILKTQKDQGWGLHHGVGPWLYSCQEYWESFIVQFSVKTVIFISLMNLQRNW